MVIGGYRSSFIRPSRVGTGGRGNFAGSTTRDCRNFGLIIQPLSAYKVPFPTIDRNVSGRQNKSTTYTAKHVIAEWKACHYGACRPNKQEGLIPRKPNVHRQLAASVIVPPSSGPRTGPSCGPRRTIEIDEALLLGSVMSATVPAPKDKTLAAPKPCTILRIKSAAKFAGTAAKRIFAKI